jgi:hypothetical protein
MGTQILFLLELSFTLKHFLSSERIFSSVRGPYSVVPVYLHRTAIVSQVTHCVRAALGIAKRKLLKRILQK